MNSMDVDVVRTAMDWMNRGHRVVLGTVVRTWGRSPRPPGSLAVIRDDGQVAGSVSGGCIEDDLIERVRRGELGGRLPQIDALRRDRRRGESLRPAVRRRASRSCSSPLSAQSMLRELLAAIDAAPRRRRRLEIGDRRWCRCCRRPRATRCASTAASSRPSTARGCGC